MAARPERRRLTARRLKEALDDNIDTEQLKTKFDISHFGVNAVIRGAQLTLVGGKYTTTWARDHSASRPELT